MHASRGRRADGGSVEGAGGSPSVHISSLHAMLVSSYIVSPRTSRSDGPRVPPPHFGEAETSSSSWGERIELN